MYDANDLETFFDAYVGAALWSTNDDSDESGGEPMDRNYNSEDIAEETEDVMVADCKKFLDKASRILIEAPATVHGYPQMAMAGHDFWLTRNGHGTGFWDGDWPEEIGLKLAKLSKSFGEYHFYIGDDGQIYGES